MPDVEELTKQMATPWRRLRYVFDVNKDKIPTQLLVIFNELDREAERERESMREAVVESVATCALCLKPAVEGKRLCVECLADHSAKEDGFVDFVAKCVTGAVLRIKPELDDIRAQAFIAQQQLDGMRIFHHQIQAWFDLPWYRRLWRRLRGRGYAGQE